MNEPLQLFKNPLTTAEEQFKLYPWFWLLIALGAGVGIGMYIAPGSRMFSR